MKEAEENLLLHEAIQANQNHHTVNPIPKTTKKKIQENLENAQKENQSTRCRFIS